MSENILLKKNPKIEFQFNMNGFDLIDQQTDRNTGFYAYADLLSTRLNHTWFPALSKWLRVFTWVLNGVPYFPDADTYKKANMIILLKNTKLGFWLTDSYMANKAIRIKELLDENTKTFYPDKKKLK